MEKGKSLEAFREEWKTPTNLVSGCQSIMHLHSELADGNLTFYAKSDALISSGLAALLIEFYNGKTPEEVLTIPPTFIEEMGLADAISPGRANGLASLHLKMKQQALAFLTVR